MAKTSKQQKKNETAKLITRIGVGGVLAVLLVLALMDRSAKASASSTTTAWLDVLQTATDEKGDVLYTDLSQHVSGSPQIDGEPSDGPVVYTWHGIFRSYTTTITCEGDAPVVVARVDGPSS